MNSPSHHRRPRKALEAFFAWYERNYVVNITITAALFTLQLVHLYWLTADVVLERLTGTSYFQLTSFWQLLVVLVDYTEIPSLLSTSVLYLFELRKGRTLRSIIYLVMVNSQWLHLFWITDEFVINALKNTQATVLPVWLAWVAILIDYLELPVIADTIYRSFKALTQGKYQDVLKKSS